MVDVSPNRRRVEDFGLAVLLGAMALLPLVEIALRAISARGVPSTAVLVQHLTLISSMAGAAIAAREGRLLSLTSLADFLPAPMRPGLRLFAAASGAMVALLLAMAATHLVLAERSSTALVAGLPYGGSKLPYRLASRW